MKQMILVVDDSGLNLRLAKEILEKQFDVACVNSGPLALEFLKTRIPDLILMDLHMPQMNGFEVIEFYTETSLANSIRTYNTLIVNKEKNKLPLKVFEKAAHRRRERGR